MASYLVTRGPFSPYQVTHKGPNLLIPRRLTGVNRLFAGLAPVIVAELAVLLDDPVAGDHQGDGVGAHREPTARAALGLSTVLVTWA